MKKILKSKKGITLIALIITVIVLLILAAVTIATLTGENGLLGKAATARQRNQESEEDEKDKLSSYEQEIDKYKTWERTGGEGTDTVTVSKEEYDDIIDKLNKLETYKTGNVIFGAIGADRGVTQTITFDKAREDANYNVSAICSSDVAYWSLIQYLITDKTETGFKITAWNNGGGQSGNVTADWILIPNN